MSFTKNFKKIVILFTICLGAAILLESTIYKWFNSESTDNAYIDCDISLISPEINGVIKDVKVQDNVSVEEGDVILEIDESDFLAKFEQAKAKLQVGENTVYVTDYNIKLESLNFHKLQESLKLINTELDIAEKEYKRTLSLKKGQYTSIKTLDTAKAELEKAKFALTKAKIDIESSDYNLTSLSLKKSIEIANLANLSEEVKIAEKALKNTKIIAPFSGIITNISAKPGNYVRSGSPVFAIIPNKKLYIKANFKETQLRKIKPGMKAEIKIDALPNIIFNGKIRNFSPATGSKFSLIPAENATGNFTKVVQRVSVLIDFEIDDEYQSLIKPGMSTNVTVNINQ